MQTLNQEVCVNFNKVRETQFRSADTLLSQFSCHHFLLASIRKMQKPKIFIVVL